jgi:hypothetical protein
MPQHSQKQLNARAWCESQGLMSGDYLDLNKVGKKFGSHFNFLDNFRSQTGPISASKRDLRRKITYLRERIEVLEAELRVAIAPEHLRTPAAAPSAQIPDAGPACHVCEEPMVLVGKYFACGSCGTTTGIVPVPDAGEPLAPKCPKCGSTFVIVLYFLTDKGKHSIECRICKHQEFFSAPSQRPLPYWQCPNDESHVLEFFPRWQSLRLRCKTCLVSAVWAAPSQCQKEQK